MRITENTLRSVIRSVIRESYGTDVEGIKARQIRDYQNHPNRARDARERKALRDEIKLKEFHVKQAAAALVDYHNRPEGQPQTRGMSRGEIENLVLRARDSEEMQKKLAKILDSTGGYDRYIGNKNFWLQVYNKFEDVIFSSGDEV